MCKKQGQINLLTLLFYDKFVFDINHNIFYERKAIY